MNERCKEYLCHMTDAEKKAYNAEYYRNHKNYWEDYYSKGRTVGRPTSHQKEVVSGGSGVKRRGMGLNDYSAITSPNGYNRRAGNQSYPSTPSSFKRDDYMYDNVFNNYGSLKDGDIRKPAYDKYTSNRHDAIVFKRMAQESYNKANDYKRAANDVLKQNRTPEDSRRNRPKYERLMAEAEREERRAKEFESNQKKVEQNMELAYAEMKRLASEIEAHNSSFTPRPSNRPGAPSAQVNSEAFSNAYKKAEKKEKVKKNAKQAYSDWHSGAKSIAKTAASSVNSGKKALANLLSKFK